MVQIIVGSQNPVKVTAAANGFRQMFPGQMFTASGVSVASGVSSQPMNDAETRLGAYNRAKAAFCMHPDAAYTVGIEGGCAPLPSGQLSVFAWVVVLSQDKTQGISKTGVFTLPQAVAEKVRGGMELGHADDLIFGQQNSKQQGGSVGLLTDNVITRTTYYQHAIVLALIPFKNSEFSF